jgi:hypothetical protein
MYLVIEERNNTMPRTLMDHKFLCAYRRNFSFIELKIMFVTLKSIPISIRAVGAVMDTQNLLRRCNSVGLGR